MNARDLRVVIVVSLAARGIGHAVGFGVAAAPWFALVWLVLIALLVPRTRQQLGLL